MSYNPSAVSTSAPYLVSGATRFGPVFELTDPSLPTWSWVNQGGATITSVNGAQILEAPATASVNLRIRSTPVSGGDFTITAYLGATVVGTNFTRVGVGLRESGTGKIATISAALGTQVSVDFWTNATTYSSSPLTANQGSMTDFLFYRLSRSGSNLTFSYSRDGNYFLPFYTVVQTSPFTTAPDQFIFFVDSNSTTPAAASLLSYRAT